MRFSTKKIVLIAMFGALVFVSNYIQFMIPLGVGGETRIHLGNAFCLLSAFLLGGVGGGLAAGIGTLFFDLLTGNAVYAPFYMVFKFVLAFVCGMISWSFGKKANSAMKKKIINLIAATAGSLAYMPLHLTFKLIEDLQFKEIEMGAALTLLGSRAVVSSINAVIAVAFSVLLFYAIRNAANSAKLLD